MVSGSIKSSSMELVLSLCSTEASVYQLDSSPRTRTHSRLLYGEVGALKMTGRAEGTRQKKFPQQYPTEEPCQSPSATEKEKKERKLENEEEHDCRETHLHSHSGQQMQEK